MVFGLFAMVLAGRADAADFAPAFSVTPDLADIRDKTLVAWCSPANLAQRGGGVLTLERTNQFDAIVLGEKDAGKWMAGSDGFARTQQDLATTPVEAARPEALVQLAVVYRDHDVTLYRNGERCAAYSIANPATFGRGSRVLIGLRHEALRHGESGFFAGTVDEARLYNVALDEMQIRALRPGERAQPAPLAMWNFEDGKTDDVMGTFPAGELFGGAYVAGGKLHLDGKDDFMMTPATARFEHDLHFRPPTGVLGDAIPFYWDGTYHVFYLKGPHWAHLASRDLVHWRELPDALEQGSDPAGPDGEACWTGSIIEHDGCFHLFYTGKNMRDPKGDQKVMMATSEDLITWTKHPEQTFYADGKLYWSKPVNGAIDDRLPYHHQAFRDPLVFWNAKESKWWILLQASRADGSSPLFALYESADLIRWTTRPPIYTYPATVSGDCPDIFEAKGKWYIIAAGHDYTVSDNLAGPYAPGMLPFDCGEIAVPKTMFDGKRHILVGWLNDRESHRDVGAGTWGGCLSMARELYPDAQGRLCQRPVREVVEAFSQPVLDLPDGPAVGARLEAPRDFMLHAQIKVKANVTTAATTTATTATAKPMAPATLRFRIPQADPAGGYHLTIDFATRKIALGGRHCSFERVCDFDPAAPVDVRLFVIGTVVECFINDAYCFTMRAYDDWGSGLSVEGAGTDPGAVKNGGVQISNLSVRVMK